MRSAKIISISLPPELNDEVAEIAKEERRSVSEVLREAFRQYAAIRAVTEVRRQMHASMKKKGRKLTEKDIVRMVREGRK